MARAPDSVATDLDRPDLTISALSRTAAWGIGAGIALVFAILAGLSESGAPRVAAAVSSLSGTAKAEREAPVRSGKPVAAAAKPRPDRPRQLLAETRRLDQQVRLLAADRDRLMQRVAALERSLEEITGSIRRQEASAQEPPQPQASLAQQPIPTAALALAAAPWPLLPPVQPVITPLTNALPPEAAPERKTATRATTTDIHQGTPLPPRRPAAAAAETEPAAQPDATNPVPSRQAAAPPPSATDPSRAAYGVDLGGASSLDRLRMLWHSLLTSKPTLLHGLRPLTHVREIRGGSPPDVRLIAGPLANRDHAAKLCAAILDAGRYCEPAVFRGHDLSLH